MIKYPCFTTLNNITVINYWNHHIIWEKYINIEKHTCILDCEQSCISIPSDIWKLSISGGPAVALNARARLSKAKDKSSIGGAWFWGGL